jgi:hypothetical protein
MPQQRPPFVQVSLRRDSPISDDFSEPSSQQLQSPDETLTSQRQSSRPRTTSTTSCAKPRMSWFFSHMQDQEIETIYYNQQTRTEKCCCKNCDKTYLCSGGTAAPAKHLMYPAPDSHSLAKGAPQIAKVTNIRSIL